jgi:hypothetical protein
MVRDREYPTTSAATIAASFLCGSSDMAQF